MFMMNATNYNDCTALGYSIDIPVNASEIDKLDQQFIKFLVVIHSVISLFGFLGNILMLAVLLSEKKLQTIPNLYVGNLAVADILICLLIPVSEVQLLADLHIPNPWCKIVGYSIMMSLTASLLSMMFIAVNRYILLVKGRHKYLKLYTKPTVTFSIIFIWLWLLINIVVIPEAGFGIYGYSDKFHSCSLKSYCFENYLYVVLLLTISTFSPANVVIGWSYIHVIYKLYKIWKKVRRRDVRLRKISEALSERSDMLQSSPTATSAVGGACAIGDMEETLQMDLSSDEEDMEDFDSEDDIDMEQQMALQQLRSDSAQPKQSLLEQFRLVQPPPSRRTSAASGTSRSSALGGDGFDKPRRRSSCIPLPTFNLKLKFRKPQWRKRCMAITNMITIYVILWLCWTPLIITYMLDLNGLQPAYVYHIQVTFLYLNSAFNVILYSIMNNSFRKALGRFVRRKISSKRRTNPKCVEMAPLNE